MEDVKADTPNNKLTVIGKVDPHKVRDKLAEKIKKKVELVSSPQPKKDDPAAADKPQEKKKPDEDKKPEEIKPEEKSSKQVRNFIIFFDTVSSDEMETNFIAIHSELTFSVLIKLKRLVPPRFFLTNRFKLFFSSRFKTRSF